MHSRLTVILGLLLLATVCAVSSADVGARPLGMGGAFVGLADDANAAYYNPAAIARLDSPQGTLTYDAKDEYGIFSQRSFSYVSRVPGKDIGYGVSYAADRVELLYYGNYYKDHTDTYWVSGAFNLHDIYLGMNIRYVDYPFPGLHSDAGIDVSCLKVINDRWSAGLLVQDINRPRLTLGEANPFDEASFVLHANVRPGVAYHADRNTVITMDLYDLLDDCGGLEARLGAEKVLGNGLALRAGYHGNTDSLTFGVGGKIGKTQLDAAVLTGGPGTMVVLSAGAKY